MAAAVRGGNVAGVVFHSGQGSEYTAGEFRAACARPGIRRSMGRPGPALDNAVTGARHSTLEWELRSRETFATRAEARAAVAARIGDYNTVRRHSALGMKSPVAWEQAAGQEEAP
jgi:transposase InsO family protein